MSDGNDATPLVCLSCGRLRPASQSRQQRWGMERIENAECPDCGSVGWATLDDLLADIMTGDRSPYLSWIGQRLDAATERLAEQANPRRRRRNGRVPA